MGDPGVPSELETLIANRGYDPEAIDEYFRRHPVELMSRGLAGAGALANVARLYMKKDYINLAVCVESMGPTYVKFGQALASRSDLVGADLAMALERLQDDMAPAPLEQARAIVGAECPEALEVLDGGVAVAAASLCQVYRGKLAGREVAVKVQRPGIVALVAADSMLLRFAAKRLEQSGEVKAAAVDAVDEFASRIFEEMDFVNEAANIRRFDALYGPSGSARHALPPPGFVRVPGLLPEFPATRRVLVMEWLDGERVTSLVSPKARSDGVGADGSVTCLIDLGIRCTLSQLIETGVMHAAGTYIRPHFRLT